MEMPFQIGSPPNENGAEHFAMIVLTVTYLDSADRPLPPVGGAKERGEVGESLALPRGGGGIKWNELGINICSENTYIVSYQRIDSEIIYVSVKL